MTCLHEEICKFENGKEHDGECSRQEFCKFYLSGSGAPKKRSYKKKEINPNEDDLKIESDYTDEQITKARAKIHSAEANNRLGDNQKKAMEALKGIRFPKLAEIQRKQIVDIAGSL